MQQTRKTSILKSLFGAKRHVEPKKAVQPLDLRQLSRVAGGAPKGGWE